MKHGKIARDGSYQDVFDDPLFLQLQKDFEDMFIQKNRTKSIEQEEKIRDDNKIVSSMKISRKISDNVENSDRENQDNLEKLFYAEDRQMGRLNKEVFQSIFSKLGGIWWFVFIYIITQIFLGFSIVGNGFMLQWSKDFENSDSFNNAIFLCVIFLGRTILGFIRAIICMLLGVKVSRLVHSGMTYRIFHAKILEFLSRVPTGRILNRFTADIENIDVNIMPKISNFILAFAYVLADLYVVATCSTYWTVLSSVFFIFLATGIQQRYTHAKREFVR